MGRAGAEKVGDVTDKEKWNIRWAVLVGVALGAMLMYATQQIAEVLR